MHIETGNRVEVDTGGRQGFKMVYHSDGNKAIRFLAAACQFNEAWCWPASIFIASLSLHFSQSDFLALFPYFFVLLLFSVRPFISVVHDRIVFEWYFSCFFQSKPPPSSPLYSPITQSSCTTNGENTRDAFPCATRDVHNPIPVQQMSYINPSLRMPRYGNEREEEGR